MFPNARDGKFPVPGKCHSGTQTYLHFTLVYLFGITRLINHIYIHPFVHRKKKWKFPGFDPSTPGSVSSRNRALDPSANLPPSDSFSYFQAS